VQRVVNRRQRNRQLGRPRFLEQHFSRQVSVATAEQQPAQRNALPGWPEAGLPQFAAQRVNGTGAHGAAAAGDGNGRGGNGHGGSKRPDQNALFRRADLALTTA
jgi:hypothetical protein